MEVLVIKKFLTLLVIFILIFFTLAVPAKAGTDLGSPKEVELSTSLKPTIGSPVQPKGNLNEKGISKNSMITTKPELQEEKTYYSDTIDEKLLDFDKEIKMLAQVVYNEARGINSTTHKAAVVWCVLNRVDSSRFDDTISEVIKYPGAFAWSSNTKIEERFIDLATDIVTRWLLEKEGYTEVGRVLPSEWLFFHGAGGVNKFKKENKSTIYWDWSLGTPYTD